MQSAVVKLYDYSGMAIPAEMRKWHVTEDEIKESLALLGWDHMSNVQVAKAEYGDVLLCACIKGGFTDRTVLLYPGRNLPGAEEAEKASVGREIGDCFTCRLCSADVTLQVKEILRLVPHAVDDELVRLAGISSATKLEEYYEWYIKENSPQKRSEAAQQIAVLFYDSIMEQTELDINEEEQRHWCYLRGKNLFDDFVDQGEDPRCLREGMEHLTDDEVFEEYIKYVEHFYREYVIFRHISNLNGFVYTNETFLDEIDEFFKENGDLLAVQGYTKEGYISDETNRLMFEERRYIKEAFQILADAADKFLED